MDKVAIIRQRTNTFADEWQARDVPLSRSESATVKNACEKLGLPLGHQPSGRTVWIILQHCMNLALREASTATSERERQGWQVAYLEAKIGLGKMLN